MFRGDFLWLLPPLLIAIYQLKFIWAKLPSTKPEEVELTGQYTEYDRLRITYFILFCLAIFWLQLVLPLLIITEDQNILLSLRLVGYLLIIVGAITATSALKSLGKNWSGMDEYQIKKSHQLIISGPYKFVRHPIYLGVLLEILGFELVANSFLFLPLLIGGFWIFTQHIKLEEKLLLQKFGSEFTNYQKGVKKIIPFLY